MQKIYATEVWLCLGVCALIFQYCCGGRFTKDMPVSGAISRIQWHLIARLRQKVVHFTMVPLTKQLSYHNTLNWADELRNFKMDYNGDEILIAEPVESTLLLIKNIIC